MKLNYLTCRKLFIKNRNSFKIMRFKDYIGEMTLRTHDLRQSLEHSRKQYEPILKEQGEHIGDIETYKLFRFNDDIINIGLYDKDILVSLIQGKFIRIPNFKDEIFEIFRMITHEDYVGQKLTFKMMMFFKTREHWPILFSSLHSEDTVHNSLSIAKTERFKMSWINMKTGELDDFKPEEHLQDKIHFNVTSKTDWQLLFEKDECDWQLDYNFGKFPRYFEEFDPTSYYEMWINSNEI